MAEGGTIYRPAESLDEILRRLARASKGRGAARFAVLPATQRVPDGGIADAVLASDTERVCEDPVVGIVQHHTRARRNGELAEPESAFALALEEPRCIVLASSPHQSVPRQ